VFFPMPTPARATRVKTQTIDQTASELQLHHVLYVLKFLRAMVLHVLLALFAFLLFFSVGINNVYPLANDLIRALRAQVIQNQRQGSGFGPVVFWIVAVVLFGAALTLLIWIYRSITNVRRFALRIQAMLLVLGAILMVFTAWPELKFAFKNLSFAFAVLATLGSATLVVFPCSVAVALWGVARLAERSSLLATLDPRLVPNSWVYLNKLLDLPRTPLRTVRTAASYVLALIGAFLLIAAVMYLLTVGATSNQLAALATICNDSVMAECVAISAAWARQVPLWLLLALAGVKVAGLLQSTAKRLGGLSVSDVIRKSDERFVLYLRPFDADDVILPKPRLPLLSRLFSFTPFPVRIEQELFDVADGYLPLIAVGKPGEKTMRGGVAYRTYLDDSEWHEYVTTKIRTADRIVIVLKGTDGVRWEFGRVIGEGATMKTLFLVDPTVRKAEERETLEKMIVPILQNAGVASEGFELKSQLIGFFFQNGRLVEIINTNRTATSYRTAFSHFLAERLG
jgi:hypothetical protein